MPPDQKSLLVEQGKGREDRWVYLSGDALESLHECLRQRPLGVPGTGIFWNRKQPRRLLTVKTIQKKMERYAKAAGIRASCHSLRHTFRVELIGGRRGGGLDLKASGPLIGSVEREVCTAVEPAGEARVLADDAEGDEQELGVGRLSHITACWTVRCGIMAEVR